MSDINDFFFIKAGVNIEKSIRIDEDMMIVQNGKKQSLFTYLAPCLNLQKDFPAINYQIYNENKGIILLQLGKEVGSINLAQGEAGIVGHYFSKKTYSSRPDIVSPKLLAAYAGIMNKHKQEIFLKTPEVMSHQEHINKEKGLAKLIEYAMKTEQTNNKKENEHYSTIICLRLSPAFYQYIMQQIVRDKSTP
jgi:hypothetical protein